MELTWINKLRIAAVAALGVMVIGILAWPLAAPGDPLMPVRASGKTGAGKLESRFFPPSGGTASGGNNVHIRHTVGL